MSTGFLQIRVGGIGNEAGREISRQFEDDGRPFGQCSIAIDTDPKTFAIGDQKADFNIPIGLDGEKLAVMAGSPEHFGGQVQAILETVGDEIDPEEMENGSKTKRWVTQLAFAFHGPEILRTLSRAVGQLVKQGGVSKIVPIVISSSGGGCGSASQNLLQYRFGSEVFRRNMMLGFPLSMLKRPVSVVVEPYAYAKGNPGRQAKKILANAYAFRKETDWLLQENRTQFVMHIGYANRYGAVLDEARMMSQVLGTATYQLMHNWETIKARLVDPEFGTYDGDDVPERLLRKRGNNFEERVK